MAVPFVLSHGGSHPDIPSEVPGAGLREITGKDVSIPVNWHPGKRVPHADVVVGRDSLLPKSRVLGVDGGPCFGSEHHRLALKFVYTRLRHQPRDAVDIRIQEP